MVTQEENVSRVAKYESFYAGTRYYGGAPVTTTRTSAGTVVGTTSTGKEFKVPQSGQSGIAPDGRPIPIFESEEAQAKWLTENYPDYTFQSTAQGVVGTPVDKGTVKEQPGTYDYGGSGGVYGSIRRRDLTKGKDITSQDIKDVVLAGVQMSRGAQEDIYYGRESRQALPAAGSIMMTSYYPVDDGVIGTYPERRTLTVEDVGVVREREQRQAFEQWQKETPESKRRFGAFFSPASQKLAIGTIMEKGVMSYSPENILIGQEMQEEAQYEYWKARQDKTPAGIIKYVGGTLLSNPISRIPIGYKTGELLGFGKGQVMNLAGKGSGVATQAPKWIWKGGELVLLGVGTYQYGKEAFTAGSEWDYDKGQPKRREPERAVGVAYDIITGIVPGMAGYETGFKKSIEYPGKSLGLEYGEDIGPMQASESDVTIETLVGAEGRVIQAGTSKDVSSTVMRGRGGVYSIKEGELSLRVSGVGGVSEQTGTSLQSFKGATGFGELVAGTGGTTTRVNMDTLLGTGESGFEGVVAEPVGGIGARWYGDYGVNVPVKETYFLGSSRFSFKPIGEPKFLDEVKFDELPEGKQKDFFKEFFDIEEGDFLVKTSRQYEVSGLSATQADIKPFKSTVEIESLTKPITSSSGGGKGGKGGTYEVGPTDHSLGQSMFGDLSGVGGFNIDLTWADIGAGSGASAAGLEFIVKPPKVIGDSAAGMQSVILGTSTKQAQKQSQSLLLGSVLKQSQSQKLRQSQSQITGQMSMQAQATKQATSQASASQTALGTLLGTTQAGLTGAATDFTYDFTPTPPPPFIPYIPQLGGGRSPYRFSAPKVPKRKYKYTPTVVGALSGRKFKGKPSPNVGVQIMGIRYPTESIRMPKVKMPKAKGRKKAKRRKGGIMDRVFGGLKL